MSTRGELLEILHRGALCVVNSQGDVLCAVGDVNRPSYLRSALKFVQVLPLIESGAADHFAIDDEEIAVMCASHNAEPRHVEVVQRILQKIDVTPDALRCGTHPPMSETAYADLLRAGGVPGVLHNNCSGKHAGFLALAKFLKAPLDNYLNPTHPVQAQVRKAVCELFGVTESNLHCGVDGCSAPNYAMSLRRQALGLARFCDHHHANPLRRAAMDCVIRAVTNHAFMVGGSGRFCTELMSAGEGRIIGKLGAAGAYVLGFPAFGIGAAIKIDDGTLGPQYNVAMELIRATGILPVDALSYSMIFGGPGWRIARSCKWVPAR